MSSSSTKMVTLKTNDGELFVVEEAVAVMRSQVIKSLILLDGAASNTTPLLIGVDGKTMAKVSEYWKKHSEDGLTEEELKDFDKDFLKVPRFVLYDILIAADCLGDKELVNVIIQEVADRIGKTPEEIREEFNIHNDFTPEEEEEIRQRLGL